MTMTRLISPLTVVLCLLSSTLITTTTAEDGAHVLQEPKDNPVLGQQAEVAGDTFLDVFDLLDSNHDGHMDRDEFHHAIDEFEDFLHNHPQVQGSSWSWLPSWLTPKPHITTVNGVKKDLSFWSGFTSAVGLIIATEIGDKTFFIAAVLSMKQDRRAVFGGAILALILMTVLSTLMGLLLPQFLDRKYTHILAGVLFGYFGLRLLNDSRSMAAHKVSEELEEVEEELFHQKNKKGEDNSENNNDSTEDDGSSRVDVEMARKRSNGSSSPANSTQFQRAHKKKHRGKHHSSRRPFHLLLLQSFTLTFVAEWGDRSQIATIALAAAKNPYGVTIGGCLGHSLCTGLAVLGGRMLAARISEKTVSQYGGILFLIFGVHSLFFEK